MKVKEAGVLHRRDHRCRSPHNTSEAVWWAWWARLSSWRGWLHAGGDGGAWPPPGVLLQVQSLGLGRPLLLMVGKQPLPLPSLPQQSLQMLCQEQRGISSWQNGTFAFQAAPAQPGSTII